jgi:hypothetical protein
MNAYFHTHQAHKMWTDMGGAKIFFRREDQRFKGGSQFPKGGDHSCTEPWRIASFTDNLFTNLYLSNL